MTAESGATGAEAPDTSFETEGVRSAAHRDLDLGLSGYEQFQLRLAHAISPREAAEAQREFVQRMRLLVASIAAIVVLQTANLLLTTSPVARVRAETAIEALGYLAALFLVSAARVPFAATVIMPFVAVMAVGTVPIDTIWSDPAMSAVPLFVALASILSGASLDYGASTEPKRTRPKWRRLTLLLLGVASLVVIYFISGPGSGFDAGIFGYLFGLSLIVWGAVAVPYFERRRPLPVDVETLLGAAFRRWRRFAIGRVLALVFGLFPFFLFLNAVGIHERLSPSATAGGSPEDRSLVRTPIGDTEFVWFSQTKGRLLEAEDFGRPEAAVHRVTSDDIASLGTLVDGCKPTLSGMALRYCTMQEVEQGLPVNGATQAFIFLMTPDTPAGATWTFSSFAEGVRFAEILGAPISSAEEFHRLRTGNTWQGAYVVERHPALPTPTQPDRREIIYAQKSMLVQGLEAETASRIASISLFVSVLLLACGALGFVLLWQRGGDSAVGRWLGIWLVGLAAVPFYALSDFFLPAFKYALWHEALVSPISAVLLFVSLMLEFLTFCFEQPHALLVPLAALWVHVAWPPSGDSRRIWRRSLSSLWRISLVSSVIILLAAGLTRLVERVAGDGPGVRIVAGTLEVVVIGTVLLAAGRWLRGRSPDRPAETSIGRLPIAALVVGALGLAVLAPAMPRWLTIGQPFFRSDSLWYAFSTGYVLMAASVILFGYLIVRRNLLRVISTRDMSNFFFVLLLPFLFEVGENLAAAAMRQTSFFSERGAELLGLFSVVVFLGPLWVVVHRFVRVAAHPRLRAIEAGVNDVLEQVVACESDEERQATVSALLGQLGVDRFALYVRRKDDSFEAISTSTGVPGASRLEVSRHLRDFFRTNRGFLDLSTAPYEWRLFFHQFELSRLASATGARYVLPIGLGPSLRGLLLVDDGPGGRDVCRDTLAEDFGHVGLAVTRT